MPVKGYPRKKEQSCKGAEVEACQACLKTGTAVVAQSPGREQCCSEGKSCGQDISVALTGIIQVTGWMRNTTLETNSDAHLKGRSPRLKPNYCLKNF